MEKKPAGGDSAQHISEERGEGGNWPGFNRLLHFFPQQNKPTAPHAFHHRDVVPPLAPRFGESTPSEQENSLSQHTRKKLTGVYVTPELDHIHHFA